ncbi:MAG: HvfC/BufC family peptide modification chaperone [Boseongicola sp.]
MSVKHSEFKAALLDPGAARPAGLRDGRGRDAGRRFDVYRNNVAVSLTEALETAFPVVAKLVGANNFKILARDFLRAQPPTSPLMMFYGDGLPDFLSTYEPASTIGYLADMARLEIALCESYHAADAAALNPLKLRSLPVHELMETKLEFTPAVRLVRSPWPIHAIWRFNTEDQGPKPAMAEEDVIVLRAEMDPEPHLLEKGAGDFVFSLISGGTFAAAIESAKAVSGDFDLSETLALLLRGNALKTLKD